MCCGGPGHPPCDVGDQRGVGGAGCAAAHRVVNDADAAEARLLPAQPDGRGAVGCGLYHAGRQGRRDPQGWG